MAPQAATAPAPSAAVPHAALLARLQKLEADGADLTSPQKQILRALAFERQRGQLMKHIAANRTYLRLMEETEELSDEEADWLEDFYPQKEKGQARSEDGVERTRKAKAAARA